MTSQELKRLKSIELEASKKKQKTSNASLAKATATVQHQPELTHGEGYAAGAIVEDGQAPRSSHDMRNFASSEGLILYCDVCGKWQGHNAGRSLLGSRCEPIKEDSKSGRKLHRHNIVPVIGAKLPAHIKTQGGTRCQVVDFLF